jgi:hypothetical protein
MHRTCSLCWPASLLRPFAAQWLPILALVGLLASGPARAQDGRVLESYRNKAGPVLNQYCLGCHSSEARKGGIAFDPDDPAKMIQDQGLWLKVIKMLQSGLMPPKGKHRPSATELAQIETWIKLGAFGIDPQHPDPGRVTIRRLNRTEYRNSIRELTGVDYNATAEFPADDTGHGFDNLGDVLTVSPLLLEKYVAAAKSIVAQSVPLQSRVPAEQRIVGAQFHSAGHKEQRAADGGLTLSYYKSAHVSHDAEIGHGGRYRVILDLAANERYVDGQFDYNKCRLTFKAGDQVILSQEFSRQGGKSSRFEYDMQWDKGMKKLVLEVEPLTPKERQVRSLSLRIQAVTIRGPMAEEHWVKPDNYERFFPGSVPKDLGERRAYANALLAKFATRAFRRSVDRETVDRLTALAEATWAKPGQSFEKGMAQAMTVVLASPRFLFREEATVSGSTEPYPLLDEYSLASRLSYFLWSSMPDEELSGLARDNKLRLNLSRQVARMLADKRAGEFVRNFSGQWLQARNVDTAIVNAFAVMVKDEPQGPNVQMRRDRFRALIRKAPETLTEADKKELADLRAEFIRTFRRFRQFELSGDLRRAMRQETEMAFEYVLRNDRSLLELIDADYTFLNERLAKHYGIEGVTGEAMRKVPLPASSPRGGVLTQGTFLVVTSNPDRTSPVKRGLFILDNILGMPPPPPPPNIPSLEQVAATIKGRTPTLRETLKVHRNDALCASCHGRMDPLGLAFENFNALGRWRDKERSQPIEASGQLLSGETFKDVRELKHVLATDRRKDYYRCLSQKMLIYALGRGLEPGDTLTVDNIVDKLEASRGRPSALISGIIEAPAFQRRGKAKGAQVATRD